MSEEEKQDQLSLDLTKAGDKSKASDEDNDKVPDGETLSWTCHPAKINKTRTIIVTMFIIAVIVAIYLWTYSVILTILGIIVLTGSLAAFYFPTGYEFTENEIRIKTTTQRLVKKWSQYRSCYPDKNGVLLSPFVRPSRLENFRGLYVRFAGNKDEVVAFVKRKIEEVRARELGEDS